MTAEAGGVSDAQLFERSVVNRDEAAFALILRRHAQVVLDVCLRVLHDLHDGEDAFQATFLAVPHHAGCIAKSEAVAGWLHKVAYHTLIAPSQRARRESRDKPNWRDKIRFFVPPQYEDRDSDLRFEGRLKDDMLQGETNDAKGGRLTWMGRRAPSLKRDHAPKWGEPVELFNGKDLGGWKFQYPRGKRGWRVQDGVLVNALPGNNLMTEKKFTDFKLHAEFRIPKGSNSGIYLRGRYELQIEDNWNQEPECHKVGGIYGFLTPSVNPAKKPGEWQTFDVTFVGRVVTILFNEDRVIDRQTIPGITGGAVDSDEGSPGPILLQGDHGRVEFRKLTLTPADG